MRCSTSATPATTSFPPSSIYGGTFNLISVTMAKMGITATFVSPDATDEELDAAFQPNTKAVFGETIATPALTVLDIERFANAAHPPWRAPDRGQTPLPPRSTAALLSGGPTSSPTPPPSTSTATAARWAAPSSTAASSTGWPHADKFPGLTTPDESYHGITYAERFGMGGAFVTKATAQLMRDFGCTQSPINAYMINLGLESLHVRHGPPL